MANDYINLSIIMAKIAIHKNFGTQLYCQVFIMDNNFQETYK